MRGDTVWPIGRGGTWSVPVNPGRISSQDPVDRHLEVEGLSVTVGSSGGPLVSKEGIVGMIVEDNPSLISVRATAIEVIESFVHDEWNFDWSIVKVNADRTSATPIAPHMRSEASNPGAFSEPPINCEEEKNLRSLGTTVPTSIVFKNKSGELRYIYWIDFQGIRKLYSKLEDNNVISFQTYISHPWIVITDGGECKGIYMPTARPQEITLN